jgi:transposase
MEIRMSRPKAIVTLELVHAAEAELAKIREGHIIVRLKAIIAAQQYPITVVMGILGVSRASIFNWIRDFKREGRAGLQDQPKGHWASKLNPQQWRTVQTWMEQRQTPSGKPIVWTLKKLRNTIKAEWDINISVTPLWKQLHKMNLTLLRPRPLHAQADPVQQKTFKKNSGQHS